jgi:rod shape-determining protein MreD
VTVSRGVAVALLLLVAAVVQSVVLSRIPLPGATPDLVLLVVVAVALTQGPTTGCVVGFAGGLLLDVVPPADSQVGRWALVLALVGWFAGRAEDAAATSVLVPVLVVGLASAGAVLGYAAVGFILNDPRVDLNALVRALPTAVLYDVMLAPFLMPLLMKVTRRVDPAATYARGLR